MMNRTNKYVMICPFRSGVGPPARIVMCHPVCFAIDSPIPASVRGILSMALHLKEVSLSFLGTVDETYNWNSTFAADSSSTGLTSFSVFRSSSHRAFISSVSFANLSLINSTMIENLVFGGFSLGCSLDHWFLYLSHSSLTSGFH